MKLFITHGGINGFNEALYHQTPMLAIPIWADQFRIAQRIVNRGFGESMMWYDVTAEKLEKTIDEIINNPR